MNFALNILRIFNQYQQMIHWLEGIYIKNPFKSKQKKKFLLMNASLTRNSFARGNFQIF